jgi:hypothetical protein
VIIPKFVNCWCEEILRRDKGVYHHLAKQEPSLSNYEYFGIEVHLELKHPL